MAKKSVVNVGAQRIYHLTHLNNLEMIFASGRLLADSEQPQPDVDISSPGNREERRAAAVGTGHEPEAGFVSQYVPFFLAPDPFLWEGLRSGATDPRLSAAVGRYSPIEFVMLVSTVERADHENAVFAAGDAADADTRFVAGEPGATAVSGGLLNRELYRLRGDEDALRRAEFLVRESFPLETVTLVAVANDKARDSVKQMLASAGSVYRPKVAVYPPWFARP